MSAECQILCTIEGAGCDSFAITTRYDRHEAARIVTAASHYITKLGKVAIKVMPGVVVNIEAIRAVDANGQTI